MEIVIFGVFAGLIYFFYEKYIKAYQIKKWIELFKKDLRKYGYLIHSKDYLTTKSEWIFLRRLTEYLADKPVIILTKVRVWDFANFRKTKKWFFPYSVKSRIDRSHVDFAIISKKDLKIICAIELDDPSHLSDIAKERDEAKDIFFDFLKIPLFRFSSSNPTDEDFKRVGFE